jgi:hypothetical protein
VLQALTQGGHVLTQLKIGRMHGGGKTPHYRSLLMNDARAKHTVTDLPCILNVVGILLKLRSRGQEKS